MGDEAGIVWRGLFANKPFCSSGAFAVWTPALLRGGDRMAGAEVEATGTAANRSHNLETIDARLAELREAEQKPRVRDEIATLESWKKRL